jgi:hypothetical protein
VLEGRIASGELLALCERARRLVARTDAEVLICDMRSVVSPDFVTLEALARLQLTVGRLGCRLGLHRACGELQDLLRLAGLTDVVRSWSELALESRVQPEQGEPPSGVEEERDPADPIT